MVSNMSYTIIVHRKGHKDLIRKGIDKLNSIIIPAELKLAYPKAFEKGILSVDVVPEN
jgi:hypothetical protein